MKLTPPYGVLFISTLILGTLLTLSGPNTLTMWLGLEINFIAIIPILSRPALSSPTTSSMTYFIIQAIGSSLFLLLSAVSPTLLPLPLLLKLGAVPFHLWVPKILTSLSWPTLLLMTTWQKMAPIIMIQTLSPSLTPSLFIILGLGGIITGGLGASIQTNIKSILAYSSISSTGWTLSLLSSQFTMLTYLFIYFMALIPLILILASSHTPLTKLSKLTPLSKLISIFTLLSLAGLPPFPGFAAKWAILPLLSEFSSPLTYLLLLSGGLMTYVYLSVSLILLMSPRHTTHSGNPKSLLLLTLILSLTPLTILLA